MAEFTPQDEKRQVELNKANFFMLRLVPLTTDTDLQEGLLEGDVWYRSDLKALKARINGITNTLVPVPGRIITGTIDTGDVGGTTGPLAVSGDIISAVASIPAGIGTTVAITFPSVGSNFMPLLTIESIGDTALDGDLKAPVVHNLTDTSLNISLDETQSVTQNLRFHVMLWPIA